MKNNPMQETDRIINAIQYHINCDKETAKMIYNGVFEFAGSNYSAYITDDEKLEICKDGFPIHRLVLL